MGLKNLGSIKSKLSVFGALRCSSDIILLTETTDEGSFPFFGASDFFPQLAEIHKKSITIAPLPPLRKAGVGHITLGFHHITCTKSQVKKNAENFTIFSRSLPRPFRQGEGLKPVSG